MGDRGTYALIMLLPCSSSIRVGALGTLDFPRGHYVYVGSALGGLAARIARHLAGTPWRDLPPELRKGAIGERYRHARVKKVFWHIDYFLQHAQVQQVWTDSSGARLECRWAHALLALPNATVVAPRFGASDCHCAAHLVHLGRSVASYESAYEA